MTLTVQRAQGGLLDLVREQCELIYTAAGNREYASLAIAHGFSYGARLPDTVYFSPAFVDQDYLHPDRAAYMTALQQHRPRLATVLDLEHREQIYEVLDWAQEAAQYVTEAVIIIPKIFGVIDMLPRFIHDKQVRLGYSIPTSVGGTPVPKREFAGWPLHLLGGSPQRQYRLAYERGWNVASADNNYIQKQANSARFFHNGLVRSAKNKYFPAFREVGLGHIDHDVPARALTLSLINMKAMWSGYQVGIRYASERDFEAVNRIARQWNTELGFVSRSAMAQSAEQFELYVAERDSQVLGFVRWHRRRDGWSTIYEIAVDRTHIGHGIGRALLEAVPLPRRLKCTVDNAANEFYAHAGGTLARVEAGRVRQLNVWEYRAYTTPVEVKGCKE